LDIGSGSGILCAYFSILAKSGQIIGVEHIPELADASRRLLEMSGHGGNVKIVCSDGRLGFPGAAPYVNYINTCRYDAIHVGAAASKIPRALMDQLAIGGCLLSPVGQAGGNQFMKKICREQDGSYREEDLFGVRYVPLTSAEDQVY
jgi:protein-L-isoaspartate(D-aspartate) O-methyltransferase